MFNRRKLTLTTGALILGLGGQALAGDTDAIELRLPHLPRAAASPSSPSSPTSAPAPDCPGPAPVECRLRGGADPVLAPLTTDLTSNRGDALPPSTLQATVWYDGYGVALLGIELADDAGNTSWLVIDAIKHTLMVATREYDITGLHLTGVFNVDGVIPDGFIDGLAFGLFWRDGAGSYHHLQSNSNLTQTRATFVGAWPASSAAGSGFVRVTPQLSDPFGREQARMMIIGAKYLINGCHVLPIVPGELVTGGSDLPDIPDTGDLQGPADFNAADEEDAPGGRDR